MSETVSGWFENYATTAPNVQPSVLRSLNAAGAFGPGTPMLPNGDGNEPPRIFEYQPGINLMMTPRSGYGVASFSTLRGLADACKEIRLNIELIKRQIRGLDFKIIPVEGEGASERYDRDIETVRQVFENPDGQYDFDAWLNMLVEELLVTDAVTIYPNGYGNKLLELVDGTTIRPLVDFRGRTPAKPIPAYVQMLYGMPTYWFSADRMLYRPLNTEVSTPYGTSPIEYFLLTVNLALRRETHRVSKFTDGNVPYAFMGIPNQYTPTQFQAYWDTIMAQVEGSTAGKSKIIPVPMDGSGNIPVHEFNQADTEKSDFDKWLMQVACWAFGNHPSEFGLMPGNGLGGSGYGDAAQNIQYRTMIDPITQHLTRLFTFIIQRVLRYRKLKFAWIGMDPAEDALKQAQVDAVYIPLGIYNYEYVQERIGVAPKYRGKGPIGMASADIWDGVPGGKPDGVKQVERQNVDAQKKTAQPNEQVDEQEAADAGAAVEKFFRYP